MRLLPRLLIFCAISLCPLAQGNDQFPVVDKSEQKARDVDRRAILETELAAELRAVDAGREALAKAPSEAARVDGHRHEENVKALRRELERLSDGAPVRVGARGAASAADAAIKRTAPAPAQAPFWDVYRRGAQSIDLQPPAKELP